MSKTRFRLDSDGDVDMIIPQPVYEFISAPKLSSWSQAALVKWSHEREHYLTRIAERCAVTGESTEGIAVSVKSSCSVEILAILARYELKMDVVDITDAHLAALFSERCGKLRNAYVPDIALFFKERLRMNLKEDDSDARILQYFSDFDKLVMDNGFATILGTGTSTIPLRKRMKQRCKLLLENVQPEMLKVEVKRMADAGRHDVLTDDVVLYELLHQRAALQQHYHTMSLEFKKQDTKKDAKKSFEHSRRNDRQVNAARDAGKQSAAMDGKNDPPRTGCWVCKGSHWLKDCPVATEAQKEDALAKMRDLRGNHRDRVKRLVVDGSANHRQLTAKINDGVELQELESGIVTKELPTPVLVEFADGRQACCRTEATVNLKIATAAGLVNVRDVACLVLDGPSEEFLLGRSTMKSLGIDVERMFEQLATAPTSEGDDDDLPAEPALGVDNDDELGSLLMRMVDDAIASGFPLSRRDELARLVREFRDCWRLKIAPDDAANLEPLRVQLRDGAVPFRCKPRRYPPLQSQFLREYTQQLEAYGLIRQNNQSRWACAVVPVKKPGAKDEFRITTDYRPLNSVTVPIAGTTPNLAVVTSSVRGAIGFASFDRLKGFWQMPLHEDSQEIFSFMTEDTIYTPTRVPQGATDSALHFQNQMQTIFGHLLYKVLLVWIDDVIVYAANAVDFIAALRQFFGILRSVDLKLNAAKSKLPQRQAKRCGKLISGEGVQHDPERIAALQQLPLPATAADLQYFLCATNWMRDSIMDYARFAAPLQVKLDAELNSGVRKKAALKRLQLVWNDEEEVAYGELAQQIGKSVPLSFPSPGSEICLFTDASDLGWAVVVTQVTKWRPNAPVNEQDHQLLVCKGGVFRDSQLNWSIVEKEAFPIVTVCTDLEYLLQRPRGFRLYCDHTNLISIFSPHTELKKHIRAKLQRWAMRLTGYIYTIEHIPGIANVWADIISRWGKTADAASPARILAVRTHRSPKVSVLRPLADEQFQRPSVEAIKEAQMQHASAAHRDDTSIVDGMITVKGKPWIPSAAKELLARLLVVSHCGAQGHRGEQATANALSRFDITNAAAVVKRFVHDCLLCKHIKGSRVIQRPWGPTIDSKVRNQVLHWDFLFLGESHGQLKYVLVLKDGLSHFCELIACTSPTAAVAAEAMIEWHKRFGTPEIWVSGNGSHFKNEVLRELSSRLKARQVFVPAYTPWINGTVERLNRDVLQVLRTLLLEFKLDTREWPHVLPLVQLNINHSQVESLGNKAPVELFTGLPVSSALDTVWSSVNRERMLFGDVSKPAIANGLTQLRRTLHELHKVVLDKKERTRLQQMANKRGVVCNFTEGDFVLWSHADVRLGGNKLMVRWLGPFRVIEARPHSFLIENLITKSTHDVHGSRLKMYADSSLHVDEEIIAHVSTQCIVLGVSEFKQHRFNDDLKRWELLVSWQGLESVEDSWESLRDLYENVPGKVQLYVDSNNSSALKRAQDQLIRAVHKV